MREGWSKNKLDQCIDNISKTFEIKTSDYETAGIYPIVSQSDDLIVGFTDDEKYLIHIENPVIVFGDHTRIVKYIDFDFCVGADGVKILSPKNFLSPKYLYHFLQYKKVPSLGYSRHYKLLKDIDVIFPKSLSLQLNVSNELDMITEMISKYDEQLKELDKLSQSIFYEMFGDPVENEKGWEVKHLGELCDIVRGGSPRPIQNYLGGNIPWIKIGDATKGDDIYLLSTKEHIKREGLSKTRLIPQGSLIFANCGVSLGFARIITFDGCIHDGWLALQRVKKQFINMIFLLKSLNLCTEYFRKLAPEGTQPNLNTTIMKNFAQILPPLPLQQSFARKIEAIEAMKSKVKEAKKEAETLLAARMQYWFE